MIEVIRDGITRLYELHRFEVAKEILGDIHPDNFTGIEDYTIQCMFDETVAAMNATKCHYCKTGEGAACNCV